MNYLRNSKKKDLQCNVALILKLGPIVLQHNSYFLHTYRETLMQVALHPWHSWSLVCRSVYQLEGKANTSSTNPQIPTTKMFSAPR